VRDIAGSTYDLPVRRTHDRTCAPPIVGLQNGGGIRDSITVGDVTTLSTFDVLHFANFIAAVPGSPHRR
jgi:hypothetical protein